MINETIKRLYDNLKPVQQKMLVSFFENKSLKYILHCSRRLGKTYFMCTVAIIYAIKKQNSLIRYASVTQKAVKQMVFPIMRELMVLVPASMRGKWNSQDGCYKFPNGSLIFIAGVNNGHEDDLRGTRSDLVLLDESGFIDRLDYLWSSVLMGQLISRDGHEHGRGLFASSSPLSPAHEFANMILLARQEGNYASYNIDMAGYNSDSIDLFAKEAGGRNTTTWRREYENELIVDSTMSIIPEWNNEYVKALPKSNLDKYYHRYESLDFGVRDKTALLLAKYMFDRGVLYVEREWTCSGQESTTRNISENVKRIEKEIGYTDVYRRVADNNSLITLQDMHNEFDLYFAPVSKDTLSAMVNEVRLWVNSGRLIVDPCCTELIDCLSYGVFQDEKRSEFGRSKALGHYDLLASLIYLVRNIDQHTNPIPRNLGVSRDTHWIPEQEDTNADILKIFGQRK